MTAPTDAITRQDRDASRAAHPRRRGTLRWRAALLVPAAAATTACAAGRSSAPGAPDPATDEVASARLWDRSEALGGVRFVDAAR